MGMMQLSQIYPSLTDKRNISPTGHQTAEKRKLFNNFVCTFQKKNWRK